MGESNVRKHRSVATGLVAVAALLQGGMSPAQAATMHLLWRPSDTADPSPTALHAASATTARPVTVVDGRAEVIDFAGWRGTAPRAVLSQTASMLSTDPGFASDPIGGSDNGSTTFDPQNADFDVSVWVKPTQADQFPLGGRRTKLVSPNIVQKGRSDTTGGYWKVSMQMAQTANGLRWAPMCSLRSGAGQVINVNASGVGRLIMLNQTVGYTLGCARTAGAATLTVVPDGGSAQTRSLAVSGSFTISNSAAVSVAHKPMTTSATDLYDGLLAGLTITKS